MNKYWFPHLTADYIDTSKVFYVFRVYPIGPADVPAESIARCLPADKYFPFIDLLYRNQAKWDPENGITDVHGALVSMAKIVGMSASDVDKCIKGKETLNHLIAVATDAE